MLNPMDGPVAELIGEPTNILFLTDTSTGWRGVFESKENPKRHWEVLYDANFMRYTFSLYEHQVTTEYSLIKGWSHHEPEPELPLDV